MCMCVQKQIENKFKDTIYNKTYPEINIQE